ncbi:hypothetical protein [Amycolatopsis tolypomycina]|uniref:Uncharacterized protein n=1 Tax=Amycolatopsis tolypomycina TaxID=208445 RepID=A0A1H4Z6Z4_9PSEU|nr:hypothetical protein [Amycolatopsis tolypomycina]SED25368.1 hypothetical protein SAMN04489727_7099 [Amycolatopsis tolypomycina]
MRRAGIAVAAALVVLGCAGCRDDLMGSPPPTSSSPAELSGIESTLNGIESDMNSDGSP